MQWLNENDDVSLEYLHGAFNRDKKDGVSKRFLHIPFYNTMKCQKNLISKKFLLMEITHAIF